MELLSKARAEALGNLPRNTFDGGGDPAIDAAKSPLSWQEAAQNVDFGQEAASCRPVLRNFDRHILDSAQTLNTQYNCRFCPFCARPCVVAALEAHMAECVKNKNSPAFEAHAVTDAAPSNLTNGAPANGIAAKSSPTTPDDDAAAKAQTAARKRKSATVNDEGALKKKARRAPKVPKQRQPFNPDKQCGVSLPSGQACARSLTCKVHSMGAKRAVPGRSAPYDLLLAAYQRESQVKQATLSAEREQSSDANDADQDISPEREVQLVMEGVTRAQCVPLARKVLMPTRMRTHNFRLREMLGLALVPKGMPSGGDALFGRALAFCPTNPGQSQYVRAPAVQRYLAAVQAQRRQRQLLQQQQLQQQQLQQQQQQPQLQQQGAPRQR